MANGTATNNFVEEIKSYWGRLSSRDRNLLVLLSVVLSAFVIFMAGVSLSRAAQKRADRIQTKTNELREVAQLTVGYRQADTAKQELQRRLKDHAVKNLFSYLEDMSKKDGLDIGGMSDKGTQPVSDDKDMKIMQQSVEVTLTHVPLDKLTKFLNDVESGLGVVKVTRLQVRPREDDNVLDAWFTVSTFTLGS
jgi:type II secretory pathway component PulM